MFDTYTHFSFRAIHMFFAFFSFFSSLLLPVISSSSLPLLLRRFGMTTKEIHSLGLFECRSDLMRPEEIEAIPYANIISRKHE